MFTPHLALGQNSKPLPEEKNQTIRFQENAEHWTDVSGHGGLGKTHRVGGTNSSLDVALHGLAFQEAKSNPCVAMPYVKSLGQIEHLTEEATTGAVRLCEDALLGTPVKEIVFEKRRFVHGVAVCTSNETDTARRKIKGLSLQFATVSQEAVVTPATTPTRWEHPSCAVWHKKVACAENEVARAARLHANKEDIYFTGIQLECMQPVLE